MSLAAVSPSHLVRAAETEAVSVQSPWRVFLVTAEPVIRDQGQRKIRGRDGKVVFDPAHVDRTKFRMSPLPPADWTKSDLDDHCWPRYQGELADFLGGWGADVPSPETALWPARVCLRTCFGISDTAKVSDLKLTIVCLGGAVAYVNGHEVGRGHMPQGDITPLTLAEDYALEAYTIGDRKTALPPLAAGKYTDGPNLNRS